MKKIVVFLITMLFIGSVYADGYNYKNITYTVEIEGVSYTVTVKFEDLFLNGIVSEDDPSRFIMDYSSIVLTGSDGVNYGYDPTMGQNDYRILGMYRYCDFSSGNSYICDSDRSRAEFSKDEINDENFIINFLPKFIKYNNNFFVDTRAAFLFYIADERNLTDNDINYFKNEFETFVSDGNSEINFKFQDNFRYNIDSDLNFSNADGIGMINNNLSNSAYLQFSLNIKKLLDEATKLSVCTEDDLNAIRTQRNVPFLDLDVDFDAGLSTACYNILFGDGLGDGNLYSRTKEAFSYVSEKGAYRGNINRLTMSYLFFQSYYQKGYAFLTGETMQVEIKDVERCSIFSEKTVEIFQYGFNVMKFAGVILGTLLCIIDIFKAIVQKDGEGKKQFSVMVKRILAIVLLILTPILVEIIFNFISTIGIDDPICGVR